MSVITISFASFSSPNPPTGVTFNGTSATVAQLLDINPTLPLSVPQTGLTADNLTFIGLFGDGDAVLRVTNFGGATTATLEATAGGFTTSLSPLPANSFTFVRSTVGGTHKLTIDGATFTKAAGTTTISLGNAPAPAGQTTIAPAPAGVSYNITGSNFNDNLFGANGNDTIIGDGGNDTLSGQVGADSLDGGAGDDSLSGGSGNDILLGGIGNDTLLGGTFNDTLTGGVGADRFAYNNTNQGVDTITDFTTADFDVIQISASGSGFSGSGLTTGALLGTQFLRGPGVVAATDTDQRFLYNTTDGALRFDADGSAGSFAPVQLATLTNLPPAFDHSYIAIVA